MRVASSPTSGEKRGRRGVGLREGGMQAESERVERARHTDGRIDRQYLDRSTDKMQMDERWMDGRMGGWVDGWID